MILKVPISGDIESFSVPFSSISCPKSISESHTTSGEDEPSQLSPGVSTRRHVAQVKKRKKRGKLKAILGLARA